MQFAKRRAARPGLHRCLPLLLACAALLPALCAAAQSAPPATEAQTETGGGEQQNAATLIGTVKGAGGEVLGGATVTLTALATGNQQTRVTDSNGFVSFAVAPGQYAVTATAPGFVAWRSGTLTLAPGEFHEVPGMVLEMATVVNTVRVTATERELATQQVAAEEKQRILGVVPNFYVSYVPNAAPLSARQKFQLAWKSSIDPFNFAISGVQAGVEQAEGTYAGYGPGAAGYGKRYGAAFADGFDSTMIGGAVLPVLFRQDPRYYYRGHGSVMSRALYAIASVAICKGDNGRWEPNYSFVLGNLAAGGISNLYYPASDRAGAELTVDNALIDTGLGAFNSLVEEFLLKKLTRGAPGNR
ncbi:MAG TPA: carboxypeptidase-like regulatory domain-containing protein [Acidobacteriaceae bacterium]|nr:carboxypeptidase-like regulatory domain-containing protein [Acidobacteriaceae bacterium]